MTGPSAFESTARDGVLRVRHPGARWLSTGWNGGRSRGETAYNVSVPEGFDRTDLGAYRDERLARAGFESGREDDKDTTPPTLFTGVSMRHARGARRGPVVAYATAGLSNPAMLPMETNEDATPGGSPTSNGESPTRPGTVNLIVGTTRRLADGAAANLVAVAAEAKATTLLKTAGVPGTTSDAVVVADDPSGKLATFSGSATPVGSATRVCVRDAIRASLRSRYSDGEFPGAASDAEHGVVADDDAEVFEL